MGNAVNQVKQALEIEGALAAALVDGDSGMMLASAGDHSFDLEIAAAGHNAHGHCPGAARPRRRPRRRLTVHPVADPVHRRHRRGRPVAPGRRRPVPRLHPLRRRPRPSPDPHARGLGQQRELSQRMHQQRLEATGSLVTAIAHDIRGALASVIFNADVLATRGGAMDPSAVRPFLDEILGGAERLKEIVDGLLDFARLRAQPQPLTALEPVLQRSAAALRSKFRDHAADLSITHAEPALRASGNPLIIEQILSSLLQNAIDAGARLVCVHCEPTSDGRVRVRVHDDGPGVPAELHGRIFEPFFTTHGTHPGLGLSTGREAARHIGGELVIDPAEYGASFSLYLRGGGGKA